jgi:microcystin-dependent protein
MNGFIGEIRGFGGNFAPRAWAFCEGQLMAISQNTALFSILGTTYGGDGRTTFGLPDLRGRMAIGPRNGPGLSDIRLGEKLGTETNTLNVTQLPSHTHAASATIVAAPGDGTTGVADGNALAHQARGNTVPSIYNSATPSVAMHPSTIGATVNNNGGNIPINNEQPILAIRAIICLQGTYPSRS